MYYYSDESFTDDCYSTEGFKGCFSKEGNARQSNGEMEEVTREGINKERCKKNCTHKDVLLKCGQASHKRKCCCVVIALRKPLCRRENK